MKKNSNPAFGLLILRVITGIIFLWHGIDKLQGMSGVIGFFGKLGFPPFLAYVVAIVETVGGAMLILGLWTTVSSALLAIVMIVALFKVKLSTGDFGKMEIDLALLGAMVAIMFNGAGALSLESCCKKKATCEVGSNS